MSTFFLLFSDPESLGPDCETKADGHHVAQGGGWKGHLRPAGAMGGAEVQCCGGRRLALAGAHDAQVMQRAGPGVGGHCIPVDPFYLSWKANEYDFYVNFIQLAAEINDNANAAIL